MTEWNIRSAVAADIDAVLSFWVASDARPTSTDNPAALARLIEDFDAVLLAERDSALVGTLIATWDGWRGNMYRLVVDQGRRRQGIALALVAAGERRLAELGAHRLCALVTDAHEHAVRFWAAAGYRADPAMTRHVKTI